MACACAAEIAYPAKYYQRRKRLKGLMTHVSSVAAFDTGRWLTLVTHSADPESYGSLEKANHFQVMPDLARIAC